MAVSNINIDKTLTQCRARVTQACHQAGRPASSITLVAVSKRQSLEKIQCAIAAGQSHFGENQAQEALQKIQALQQEKLIWHFIGTLQSNKTKIIAENFHWVHSLSSEKHALRLSHQRPSTLPALNVCLQINIDHELNKSGITLEALPTLVQAITHLPRLKLRGLMCIPQKNKSQHAFRQLKQAFLALQQTGITLDTLSMGMSADFEDAIIAGSTMVRIGSLIFGARNE
jgi:PLP dependent protein